MSHFDLQDFGEAAPFLRKSEMELLVTQTIAFDGRSEKHTANTQTHAAIYINITSIFTFN